MIGAILGGAAISGGLGLLGASKSAKAQKNAAKQSTDVQRYMFDQSQAMQQPWQQTGASALAQLAGLYGLNPINYMGGQAAQNPGMDRMAGRFLGLSPHDMREMGHSVSGPQYAGMPAGEPAAPPSGFASQVPAQSDAMAAFYTSPGYQFRMDEGMKALGGMASAQGLRGSGATSEDIMRYSQGLASDEYNQYTNRLAALAGVGQTSAGQMGNQALLTGRGMGDAYSQAGNARASGILGVTNTLGNTINNAAWMYGMYGGGRGTPSGGTGGTGSPGGMPGWGM